jgi:hypothetical protein
MMTGALPAFDVSRRSFLIAGAGALALGGCATTGSGPRGTRVGAYRVGRNYSVTLGENWADISAWLAMRPQHLRLLTIDGPFLNRLYLTDGIRPGGFIVRPASRDRPTPSYRTDMTSRERIEFVTDSIVLLGGMIEPRAIDPRPAKFGAIDGLRFDVEGQTESGLLMGGTAMVAEHQERLYVLIFYAPTEHYLAARMPEVESVIASITLGGAVPAAPAPVGG